MLGTLITEWEAGATACALLFATEETASRTADQLAAIAAFFGFDGATPGTHICSRAVLTLTKLLRMHRKVKAGEMRVA